jgi:hypothetical protein
MATTKRTIPLLTPAQPFRMSGAPTDHPEDTGRSLRALLGQRQTTPEAKAKWFRYGPAR